MGRITRRIRVHRVTSNSPAVEIRGRADIVGVEEPLELRIASMPFTTTMRTPGDDIELAHGFLFSEGLIRSREDIAEVRYCAGSEGPDGLNTYNVLEIVPAPGVIINPAVRRNFTTTSACGVCGTSSIDQVMENRSCSLDPVELDPELLISLPERMRSSQKGFDTTGGMHAAGLFTLDGELIALREDVGRHNAVDKIVGHLLMNDLLPASQTVLAVTSRASFELVQKAIMAGIPALTAVSAATSLAVDAAREAGLVLAGFTRSDRMNVYSGYDCLKVDDNG